MDSCNFYQRVGACRHGSKCVRKHIKPTHSNVVLCGGLYDSQRDTDIAKFVEDIFCEAALIAPVEDMLIAQNTAQQLKGNVYISFRSSRDAEKVLTNFNRRWYGGKPVFCEPSPVRDLRGTCCRESVCSRQLECNYVHAAPVSERVWESLYASQAKTYAKLEPKPEGKPIPTTPSKTEVGV